MCGWVGGGARKKENYPWERKGKVLPAIRRRTIHPMGGVKARLLRVETRRSVGEDACAGSTASAAAHAADTIRSSRILDGRGGCESGERRLIAAHLEYSIQRGSPIIRYPF